MGMMTNIGIIIGSLAIGAVALQGAETAFRVEQMRAVTDNAALAGAQALAGLTPGSPCEVAGNLLAETDRGVQMVSCDVNDTAGEVRIIAQVNTLIGVFQGRARAG